MSDIMTFNNISKSFGDVQALKDISFSIPANSIFGLLGPNGAGKTTLIRIITKIFAADSGEILFDGKNIRSQGSDTIGYMPEEKGMYKKMKVGEQLLYLGQLKGLTRQKAKERSEYWLEKLNAADWWNKKLGDLSKGMQQKTQFIATVMHNPKLLILDEPFSGLDPVNSELIKNEIYNLHQQGVTIIFSTHRMEQVEEICKNIVLINKGTLVITGEVKDIRNRFKENMYRLVFGTQYETIATDLFEIISKKDNEVIIKLKTIQSGNDLLQYFIREGAEITSYNEILPSLTEIFIQLVKETRHEQNVVNY
ncbi:MAG: ABC transporter ATP-binding protein [Chitinophagales bacterium]